MVVSIAVRCVAAAVGALLVLIGWSSLIGTLVVARPVASFLTRWVDWVIVGTYRVFTDRVGEFHTRDRVLATQAATILLAQLGAWMGIIFTGFALLLWPFARAGIASAFIDAGSSMFTLGFAEPTGGAPDVLVFLAAVSGLVVVALQVGYLPTLYASFNRRETEVALLNARSGSPSWGPELLARTYYALGTGESTLDTLPELYSRWERWAADVAESHTTYLPLVRFRSPRWRSSWITALIAVLDSAALLLSLAPERAPVVEARLCLRGGKDCFIRISQAMGYDVPDEADPDSGISLTFDEFRYAVSRLEKVGFPMSRAPEDAWHDFVGWRLNYERPAYLIAEAVDAVPAMWSGPRRRATPQLTPVRPPPGRRTMGNK
ncbi:MAG TPA: hypothetical protein VG142_14605 [Trebonia sp.]|jgi:hypothetical protein|nr:hypothetical protein [Trebonia sp.]